MVLLLKAIGVPSSSKEETFAWQDEFRGNQQTRTFSEKSAQGSPLFQCSEPSANQQFVIWCSVSLFPLVAYSCLPGRPGYDSFHVSIFFCGSMFLSLAMSIIALQ